MLIALVTCDEASCSCALDGVVDLLVGLVGVSHESGAASSITF